jgi:hypothetical protein
MSAKCCIAVVVVWAGLMPALAGSMVIHVPADQPTIQDGVSAAASGDTVLVSPGTYSGPLNRDIDFGGVNVVLRAVAGPEVTVIDCTREGRGFHFHGGEDPTAVVEGFAVIQGEEVHGGAVLCENASPTIRGCVLEMNRATETGGAMACFAASPVIEDCTFWGNTSEIALDGRGGGLCCAEGSSPDLTGCVFSGNASDMGGAVACLGTSSPSLTRCLIFGNAGDSGGALGCLDSSCPTVDHCTMAYNIGVGGAGIYCGGVTSVGVVSTIIAFGSKGEAVECSLGGSATLACCDVYMNEYGDWCGCLEGQNGINGNICADPLFCWHTDPLKRYMLHADSPCAPENSPGCGGIGAFGVGCESTPVTSTSWGAFKARFRLE